jgi:hypothetical protein
VIEANCRHILRCLGEVRRRKATRIVVKQAPHDNYTAEMRGRLAQTVLAQPSCSRSNSYYFDRHGDAPLARPVTGPQLWWASGHFNLDDYAFSAAAAKELEATPAQASVAPADGVRRVA